MSVRLPVRRLTVTVAVLAGLTLAGTLGCGTAEAHGSMQNPPSRVEGCYLEGPEHPKSAACRAAVAAGGTQALYDWNAVRIGDAAGRHRELIPDGKLCSANAPEFAGLDLPRADWPATNLTSGADFTFRYHVTAQHKGTFRLYLTNAGYDPAKPLRWADLEQIPFLTVTDPTVSDGSYVLPGKVPAGRKGRQLIYAIWQRSDSPEAFYSCSDVVFDGSGAPAGSAGTPSPGSGAAHSHEATEPGTPTAAPPAPPAPSGAAASTEAARPVTAAVTGTPSAAPDATGTGTAAARPAADGLAQTGTDRSTGLAAAVGGAFLLAGATVVTVNRRRRRPGSHAR
ncbi:lytic polysaccharide monooxygenase [Kitasatospora sp. NPDC048540]|uniref:lytic polysaccharide monooxygenase auxiliary activity family 9 protein n=1 Tax=Kitasatospora sp. NPDC048540 TaxID=3155634 RepID=UPI0033C800BD